mgnify:FL=1
MNIYEMNEVRYHIRMKKKSKELLYVDRLALNQSEILGVIGPNGAGKSTLLKVMALLATPTSGTITYRGQQIYPGTVSLATRRKMATVFQQPLLLNTSVYHNIAVGLKLRNVSRKEQRERVQRWMEMFNIAHLAKQHAYTLSGGESQRVSLARALVLQPDILFLDEPFSALDFPTKQELMKDLIQVLRQTRTTTLFVSHDLLEIKQMADRLIVLMNGRITQEGQAEQVIRDPNEQAQPFLNKWKDTLIV